MPLIVMNNHNVPDEKKELDDVLISILPNRSSQQRVAIRDDYNNKYKKVLVKNY